MKVLEGTQTVVVCRCGWGLCGEIADGEGLVGWIGKMVHRNDVLQWRKRKRLQELQKTVTAGRDLACLKTKRAIATLQSELGNGQGDSHELCRASKYKCRVRLEFDKRWSAAGRV